jgi:hypothetical protein
MFVSLRPQVSSGEPPDVLIKFGMKVMLFETGNKNVGDVWACEIETTLAPGLKFSNSIA